MKKLENFQIRLSSTEYKDVKSNASYRDWDKLRRIVLSKANNECQWCKSKGVKRNGKNSLEVHEVWDFCPENKTQTLADIVVVCQDCYLTQNIGVAKAKGITNRIMDHFKKVTKLDGSTVAKLYAEAIFRHRKLSKISDWRLDLSYLDNFRFDGDKYDSSKSILFVTKDNYPIRKGDKYYSLNLVDKVTSKGDLILKGTIVGPYINLAANYAKQSGEIEYFLKKENAQKRATELKIAK